MVCPYCTLEFEPHRCDQIYCTERCGKRAGRKRFHSGSGQLSKEYRKRRDEHKQERRKQQRSDYIYADKIANGCSRCSERRPYALQYHHVDPSTKEYAVSAMKGRFTLTAVKREIDKCILLCGNCHLVEENGDGYRPEDRPNV